MSFTNIAIPLFGKMATRSYHSSQLIQALERRGFTPRYFISSKYLENCSLDRDRYFDLNTEAYDRYASEHSLLKLLREIRRFSVRTETTDLRFRERIEQMLFDRSPVAKPVVYGLGLDLLRRIPGVARLACAAECALFDTAFHLKTLQEREIRCVLTPGMGGHSFYNEGFVAREARRLGLATFASITNYDNLVNMGFRGYLPDCVGVWSQSMADDAIRLQKIPARRIEVTGPVQFDRYFQAVGISREDFLRSKGLDPMKKTILYGGGVSINRYFEIYRLLCDPKHSKFAGQYNLIIRVYPAAKLLSAPAWSVLEDLFAQTQGIYISNALKEAGDNLTAADLAYDLNEGSGVKSKNDLDELHCLLKYSDVMINYFSTISLEAALCDLPTIHVGYDGYTFGVRYGVTSSFQQRQTHNKRKLRLAASRVAKSEQDLMKHLEELLADRSIQRDERREYAAHECGPLDGKASERLAEMVNARYSSVFSNTSQKPVISPGNV